MRVHLLICKMRSCCAVELVHAHFEACLVFLLSQKAALIKHNISVIPPILLSSTVKKLVLGTRLQNFRLFFLVFVFAFSFNLPVMKFSSALNPEKDHYYHLVPDSESPSLKKSDLIIEGKNEESPQRGEAAIESQKYYEPEGVPVNRMARFNNYALAGAILASTNSILLGYDIGVMSGAVLYIQENLKITSTQVEILVGSLNACSLIGSLASGKTSDCIGRRYTIVLAAATFLIGALLMGFAPSYLFLMAGRVVAGIGVGYSLMIAPVYTTEISPAMSRGFLSSLPEVFINFGILLGYMSSYALSGLPQHINWRVMLGLAALPAVIVALGVMAMPESPRWLVMKGRFAEAKQVLIRISDTEEEAGLRLTEMTKGDTTSSRASSPNNWRGQGVWKELLFRPSRPLRRILIAAIGINFFMQASGNDAVIYYSPEVFRDAGISSKKQLMGVTVVMGIAKTSFVLISALFLDHCGRRPLLLLGSSGMAVSLAMLGVGSKYLEQTNTNPTWAIALCIVAVCADVSFFSIGLGPVTWVYSSEIFPTKFRAQGSSLSISVNRLVSGIVSMTFLSISQEITFGGMFFALAGIMAVATLFIYWYLPETKGKSLEEIGVLFEDKVYEHQRAVIDN